MSVGVSQFSGVTPTLPVPERLAPVSVIHPGVGAFSARLADLQPGTMRLEDTAKTPPEGDEVTVLLFGRRLQGTITHAEHCVLTVEFDVSPDIFETIEAFEDFKLSDDASGGFDDARSTEFTDIGPTTDEFDALPAVDGEARLTPRSPLDGLGMLLSLRANRPVMVRAEGDVSKVRLCFDHQELEVRAIQVASRGYLLLPPEDHTETDSAIAKLREALDRTHPAPTPQNEKSSYDDDLPVLHPNGSIAFRSYEQFLFQVECNLSKGAVMAKGTAGALGSQQALKLLIPDTEPIEVPSAELLFQDQGRVGFSVQHPKQLRNAILGVVTRANALPSPARPAPTPMPVLRPAATPKPKLAPVAHRVALSATHPSPQALIDFARTPAHPITAAGGWYIGVLDRALRLGQDLLLTVSSETDSLRIWIYRGHIVAALRRPAPGNDRLGQRLVAKRIIQSDMLRDALKVALKSKKPVGQVVLETKKVPPSQVHRALRYQLLDRITIPQTWKSGWIEVGEMTPLPVKADLIAISRNAAVAHLLRQQLSTTRLGELREAMRRYLNQPLQVDLSNLSPSFRFTEREQQFITKCANAQGSLAAVISQSTARPLEAYRMLLLATALGIVTPTESKLH